MAVSTDPNHLYQRDWIMRFRPLTAALLLLASGCAAEQTNPDVAATALIARIGQEELAASPEFADVLGVTPEMFGGRYADSLDDRTIAFNQRLRADRLVRLAELEQANRTGLSPALVRQLDAAAWTFEAVSRVDRHGYGIVSLGGATPYLINPSDGAYVGLIKFLTLHHPVRSRADAEAWLNRLANMDDAIRDETRRLEVDVGLGATPSHTILQRTLDKVRLLSPTDARTHQLTLYLTESLSQIPDLPESEIRKLVDDAVGVLEADIAPAYAALAAVLQTALENAPDDPGVWRLPNGEAYYRDVLHLYTGADMTPKQIHDGGLKLVEELTGKLDEGLIAIGRADGTVAQRLQAMSVDPAYLYAPTPEGQAAMLAAVASQIDWANGKLAGIVTEAPRRPVELRQAPAIAADTAPLAYYRPAALDGSRPATYTLNLRSTLEMPTWSLPTITYHEAVPGHHVQAGGARERWSGPVLALLMSSPAFSEGWAVYAEDLADELGAYANDPVGRLGYLQSLLFRAARMVADTGLHSERWSRGQAIDYLVDTTGLPRAEMEREVDRYTIWPGQAASYMIGRETIRRLRQSADRELGSAFDLRAFHDAVLAGGARPLPRLEADIRDWVAARRRPVPAAD